MVTTMISERDQDDNIPYEEWEDESDLDDEDDSEIWDAPEEPGISELDFHPDETYRGEPEKEPE